MRLTCISVQQMQCRKLNRIKTRTIRQKQKKNDTIQEGEKCVCVCISIYATDVREADQDPKLRQTIFYFFILVDNAGARGTSFATYIKDQCSSSEKSKANASRRKLEATQTTAEEIMYALLTPSRNRSRNRAKPKASFLCNVHNNTGR